MTCRTAPLLPMKMNLYTGLINKADSRGCVSPMQIPSKPIGSPVPTARQDPGDRTDVDLRNLRRESAPSFGSGVVSFGVGFLLATASMRLGFRVAHDARKECL